MLQHDDLGYTCKDGTAGTGAEEGPGNTRHRPERRWGGGPYLGRRWQSSSSMKATSLEVPCAAECAAAMPYIPRVGPRLDGMGESGRPEPSRRAAAKT